MTNLNIIKSQKQRKLDIYVTIIKKSLYSFFTWLYV